MENIKQNAKKIWTLAITNKKITIGIVIAVFILYELATKQDKRWLSANNVITIVIVAASFMLMNTAPAHVKNVNVDLKKKVQQQMIQTNASGVNNGQAL